MFHKKKKYSTHTYLWVITTFHFHHLPFQDTPIYVCQCGESQPKQDVTNFVKKQKKDVTNKQPLFSRKLAKLLKCENMGFGLGGMGKRWVGDFMINSTYLHSPLVLGSALSLVSRRCRWQLRRYSVFVLLYSYSGWNQQGDEWSNFQQADQQHESKLNLARRLPCWSGPPSCSKLNLDELNERIKVADTNEKPSFLL